MIAVKAERCAAPDTALDSVQPHNNRATVSEPSTHQVDFFSVYSGINHGVNHRKPKAHTHHLFEILLPYSNCPVTPLLLTEDCNTHKSADYMTILTSCRGDCTSATRQILLIIPMRYPWQVWLQPRHVVNGDHRIHRDRSPARCRATGGRPSP